MFVKTPDDALASLVKEIDKVVAANSDKKMAAVVNFTGEPSDDYTEQIKLFGEEHKLENVALTITKDAEKFKVNDDAEVTVMHYRGKKVAFNHAVAKGGLDKSTVKQIVDGTKEILD